MPTRDELVLRPALPSEHAALEALMWRASLGNPGDRDVLLAHPEAVALPIERIEEGRVIVALREGAVIGFASVLPVTEGVAELDDLFVEPDRFRQGIGRALVERCAELARAEGAAVLHVVANAQAEAFYEACGFASKGSVPTRFSIALSMQKTL